MQTQLTSLVEEKSRGQVYQSSHRAKFSCAQRANARAS